MGDTVLDADAPSPTRDDLRAHASSASLRQKSSDSSLRQRSTGLLSQRSYGSQRSMVSTSTSTGSVRGFLHFPLGWVARAWRRHARLGAWPAARAVICASQWSRRMRSAHLHSVQDTDGSRAAPDSHDRLRRNLCPFRRPGHCALDADPQRCGQASAGSGARSLPRQLRALHCRVRQTRDRRSASRPRMCWARKSADQSPRHLCLAENTSLARWVGYEYQAAKKQHCSAKTRV